MAKHWSVTAKANRLVRTRAAIRAMKRANIKAIRSTGPRIRSTPFPAQLRARSVQETKSVDLKAAGYTLNTTAQFTLINAIQGGSSMWQRIGRKIEMQSVYIVGQFGSLRTASNEDYGRIMLIYDRQANSAPPVITDIIKSYAQDGTTSSTAYDHFNLDNRDRIQILMDERVILPAHTDTAGVETNLGLQDPTAEYISFKRYIKLKGLVTQYKAESNPAVIGDIATGSLYLVTFTANQASGAEGWSFSAGIRLRYRDA